ncbi:Os03g0334200, partial [Oryza sativa Japonica Group]
GETTGRSGRGGLEKRLSGRCNIRAQRTPLTSRGIRFYINLINCASCDVLGVSCFMASVNTGGLRLVRCPKCYNILPEPPSVEVYKCGGCDTILRVKIRPSNGQNVATKQVRQDSDDFSVATTASNGVHPQKKDIAFSGATMDRSRTPDAPSTDTEHASNGTSSNDNGHAMSVENNASEVADTDNKEDCNLDGQNTSGRIEGPSEEIPPNANGMDIDSDREETYNVEGIAENSEDCRVRGGGDIDTECNLSLPEHELPLHQESKSDSELKEATKTEDEATKKGHLVRVQSRSCDLRESHRASAGSSMDFHSARTSLQSKSFRASEPLQSKIMKTVDELRGDLSEFFSKPEEEGEDDDDRKPKTAAYPPRPSKQDGYSKPRAPFTSSVPLTAYHPAAKHSGHVSRLSRSGQVPPPPHHHRELSSLRYRRRRRAYSCCHSDQMETMRRPCSHDCCHYHSCRPPPCHHHDRPWKSQEGAMQRPPVQETTRRRAPPRHHCRPVLRGAPFVVCSGCNRLVQLPTDFAVPSKGTRRLQCGSCSEILSYSYRDPAKKKLQSPSGDGEECQYSTDDYEIHQAAGDADPFSYSEEYGVISYSTEEEQQPLHVSRNSSFDTVDDERSAKLHRLMGYSSASELLRLRRSPDLYESFGERTPAARTSDTKGKAICVADEEEHPSAKVRRGRGLPLPGILKKGIHGLESLKLR